MSAPRLAVIGAGVSGLSAARAAVGRAEVTVLEASARAGGLVHTERAHGLLVEHGPDCLATGKPAGLRAVRELGLENEIVHALERRSYVLSEGALHPLPAGLLAMSPDAGLELLRSPLLSPGAKARMLLEPLIPRGPDRSDESVGEFFERRLGREVVDRVVDPLLGGIYGADAWRLSLRAVLPALAETGRTHRSLASRLARRASPSAGKGGAGIVSLRSGMGALPEALAAELAGRVRTRAEVRAVERTARGFRIRSQDGARMEVDAVVVATPPWRAAELLEGIDPDLAAHLDRIRPARLDAVTLAWPREAVRCPLVGTGFVVAADEPRRLRACTWTSQKWPSRAPDGVALLRAFLRDGAGASDDEMVGVARAELREVLGIEAAPLFVRVTRRERALPIYEVGHPGRVAAIEARVAAHGALALAGNAYRGLGIPDCIASGEAAAEAALAACA